MTLGKAAKFNILFILLSLIWGLTWIPIKLGIAVVPPNLFASTRFIAAGIILLVIYGWRYGPPFIERKDRLRLIAIAIIMFTISFALLYWGMQHISSGLAALFNLTFVPLSLMVMAFLLGEETISVAKIRAILIGILGLVILFRDDFGAEFDLLHLYGSVAAAIAAIIYCTGAIMSRPLLQAHNPILINGWANLLGGSVLFFVSLLFEPNSPAALENLLDPVVFSSWVFLVVFGSVIAFTAFLILINEYSPTKTGMYAFVSPVIAIIAGIIFLGEDFDALDFIGVGLLLAATVMALFRVRNGILVPPELTEDIQGRCRARWS